jgi:glutamine synthetase
MDGKIKELKIPIANTRQAEIVLSEGERVDGSSLFKGIVTTGSSDLYIVPVYHSAFINPFDDKSLDFICRFIDRDGKLAWFAPDNVLHNAADLLRKNTGLELWALGELEFYLIGAPSNRSYPLEKQKGYHATAPFVKSGPIINEMLRYITQIYGNVKYAHNEVGYLEKMESDFEEFNGKSAEQVEIEFLPTPIEETADCLVTACWIIRNVAYKYGYIATFFPKIEVGHAGNGMHVHMALKRDGKNIMTTDSGDLSEEALMLIGGLCNYAPSLTAFGNMVPASYLRLVPKQEAPTRVCWSESNRSALIRVPLAWTKVNNLACTINPQQKEKYEHGDCRQTVELRSPDGSANAHLLLSGITMAAEWGLTNKKEALDLAKSCYAAFDIHSTASMENLEELATSCVESAEVLLQVRKLYERSGIFPPNLISFITNQLRGEHDTNLNSRLMAMPEDERLYQSRRIMHRDLHKH